MGKFSLLTSLTLNTAGYNKGINKAKQSTADLKKGIKSANTGIKQSFSGLQPAMGGFNSQLFAISNVAKGAIGAMGGMSKAIKGVKGVLIASGVGAIVIAIGVAFAALNSYLKGTVDGANLLNQVLGIVKGAFNAILVRVQLLGEAISLVFQGNFREAGEKLKEAFSGGLIDEIKDSAKEANEYAKRENKHREQAIKFIKKEADLRTEIARLVDISSDKTLKTEVRAKATAQAIKVQNDLSKEKIALAEEEYNIIVAKNSQTTNGFEEEEKEAELYASMVGLKKEQLDKVRELKNRQEEITTTVKAEERLRISLLDKARKLKDTLDDIYEKEQEISDVEIFDILSSDLDNLDLEDVKFDVQFVNADTFANSLKTSTFFITKMREEMRLLKEEAPNVGQVLYGILGAGIDNLSNSLLQGADSFKEFGAQMKASVKDIIGTMIAQGVAAMVMGALRDWSLSVPFGFLVAPAAAALAGGVAKSTFNSLIPNFTGGGIVGGSLFTGDKIPIRVNSQEMILNRGQQGNLFNMINSGGNTGGEVVFRILGDDLVGLIDKNKRKSDIY